MKRKAMKSMKRRRSMKKKGGDDDEAPMKRRRRSMKKSMRKSMRKRRAMRVSIRGKKPAVFSGRKVKTVGGLKKADLASLLQCPLLWSLVVMLPKRW